jgi:HK97 family phage major capsid protein
MLGSTNVSGGNVPVEQRLPGFDLIPSRRPRLLDIVSRGTADSNIISWVSQANKEGAVGQTAEGALKNQIDFDLVVNTESLKKTTGYIKISEEMLTDISFIESEINNELMREILKAVELQVYSGDGTGNNLNGILTQATAFAAGTFALSVDNANLADVLTVAANQIKLAEHDAPNYILLNPSDVTALKLIKASATDKRYVDRLVMVAGEMSLDGIPILETTLVTQDTYLIGDFRMATVFDKGMVDIKVGYENDDFTKNLVTILAEWRGLNIIKTNQTTAFVTGTISTDAAALETI